MASENERPGVDASVQAVFTTVRPRDVDDPSIGSLLTPRKWGEGPGTGVTLTTSFSVAGESVYVDAEPQEVAGLQTLDPALIALARETMTAWAQVADLRWVEVPDDAQGAGDIRWSISDTLPPEEAHAYRPNAQAWGGDIWLGPLDPAEHDVGTPGSLWGLHFMQLLGLALGLRPPGSGAVAVVEGQDQIKYSVMSGLDHAGSEQPPYEYISDRFPIGPMLNDIAAIQWLYGANMEHATGDDVYRWEADAVVFETIWDAGGEDTLDASNQAQGVVLNLNAGQWSSVGIGYWNGQAQVRDTLTIAYGAVIEHAVGSAFDDVLVGNAVGNLLDGGAGEDTVSFAHAFEGLFNLLEPGVEVNLAQGWARDEAGSTDTLVSIEHVFGSDRDDTLIGSDGDNLLRGGPGSDWIDGGAGEDTVSYADLGVGTTVDLRQGEARVGDGLFNTDTLIGIEHAIGSQGDDVFIGTALGNRFDGGAGFDMVHLGHAPAAVWVNLAEGWAQDGEGGLDTLVSIEGAVGGNFDDTLIGDGGGNLFEGRGGHNLIDGGAGRDTASYRSSVSGVQADLVQGRVQHGDGVDTLVGIENLVGSGHDDALIGDARANRLEGGDGRDLLEGGAGHDSLFGGKGADTLVGGAGHDRLDGGDGDSDLVSYAQAAAGVVVRLWQGRTEDDGDGGQDTLVGIERVQGSAHTDWLAGDAKHNRLWGGGGDDTLRGGSGDDTLAGGVGHDRLDGGAGFDVADYQQAAAGVVVQLWRGRAEDDGDGGRDTLVGVEAVWGSGHDDFLAGDAQANVLLGLDGHDTLRGGSGDDTLGGGRGQDLLHGGAGLDTAYYGQASSGVVVKLWKGRAEDDGEGGQDSLVSIEHVWGSDFDDFIAGDAQNNRLDGGEGHDTLRGGSGDDTLIGGTGDDLLDGGAGDDLLEGGEGDDILIDGAGNNVFDPGHGHDTLHLGSGSDRVLIRSWGDHDLVHGFSTAQGDVLALAFDLNGSGITTATQALNAAAQIGADVVLDLGEGHSLTLVGVSLADLGLGAFEIV